MGRLAAPGGAAAGAPAERGGARRGRAGVRDGLPLGLAGPARGAARWGWTRPRRSWPPPGAASRSWACRSRWSRRPPSGCRCPTRPSTWPSRSTAPRSGPTPTGGSRRRRACCGRAGAWSSCATSTLAVLCSPDTGPVGERLVRPQFGLHRFDWRADGDGIEFHLGHGDLLRLLRASGFEVLDLLELQAPPDAAGPPLLRPRAGRLGAAVAGRGDLGRPEGRPRRGPAGGAGLTGGVGHPRGARAPRPVAQAAGVAGLARG